MRLALALALLLAGCTRKPAGPPPAPLQPQRCAPGAYQDAEPKFCLALPKDWSETRRDKEPAFDRTTVVFEGLGADGPDVTVVATWFANGRSPEARDADYRAALAASLDGGSQSKVLARGPTDDGNGEYLELQFEGAQGPHFESRSVTRSDHYRLRCEASVENFRDAELLGACRTLSAPP